MNRVLDVVSSLGATLARAGFAASLGALGTRPEHPLELWDFEGCPYCRKVREALSILDLDAQVWPCPKGGPRFRVELARKAGKAQFPYLADPNTGKAMYESDHIVRYLFDTYGRGSVPWLLAAGVFGDLSSTVASAFRPSVGIRYRPARAPAKPLELWSFEASPFCRIVREALCTLELPYLLHNVAKGSPRRDAFIARSGKMMVPWLSDPNTGTELFESADIVNYLGQTYARG
jgi:glutathione S-transferase